MIALAKIGNHPIVITQELKKIRPRSASSGSFLNGRMNSIVEFLIRPFLYTDFEISKRKFQSIQTIQCQVDIKSSYKKIIFRKIQLCLTQISVFKNPKAAIFKGFMLHHFGNYQNFFWAFLVKIPQRFSLYKLVMRIETQPCMHSNTSVNASRYLLRIGTTECR